MLGLQRPRSDRGNLQTPGPSLSNKQLNSFDRCQVIRHLKRFFSKCVNFDECGKSLLRSFLTDLI